MWAYLNYNHTVVGEGEIQNIHDNCSKNTMSQYKKSADKLTGPMTQMIRSLSRRE